MQFQQPNSTAAFVAAALALCAFAPAGRAQPGLYLKTATGERFSQALEASASLKRKDEGKWHWTLVYRTVPGISEVQTLQQRGATVVQFVPERGVIAAVPDGVTLDDLNLEWAGRLRPEQKISPALLAAGLLVPIPGDTGVQSILVEFHSDVDRAVAEAIVLEEGASIQQNPDLVAWQMLVKGGAAALARLAEWDEVSYLFPVSRDLAEGRPVEACAGAINATGRIGQIVAKVGEGWDGAGKGTSELTYSFGSMTRRLTADQVRSEAVRAMSGWTRYVRVRFSEGGNAQSQRNINFLFGTGDHGDGYPFDGAGKSLAHTFFPAPPNPEPIAGDLHIDDDESWQNGASIDLFSVILHEMGHALGLGHSDSPSSVMYPYYRRVTALAQEDITAIQDLYAAGEGSVTGGGTNPANPTPAVLQLAIAQPSGTALETTAEQTAVSGSASGGTGAIQVSWANSRGGSGVATGSQSWVIPAVALQLGENVVTVTASDGAQARVAQQVRILRVAPQTTPPPTTPTTNTAPSIRIVTPAATGIYQTAISTLVITGTAGPDGAISQVLWANSRGSGGSVVGSAQWAIGPVLLESGVNVIRVTAVGQQGATAEATLSVQYSPPGVPTDPNDRTAPTLQILSPSLTTLTTAAATITITGTASDNVAVSEVNWTGPGGRSGLATGASQWQIPDLPLVPGINVIIVRAYDGAGNMSWRSLVITRQ